MTASEVYFRGCPLCEVMCDLEVHLCLPEFVDVPPGNAAADGVAMSVAAA